MSEAKRPLRVFLCHAHDDKEAVRALYQHLIKDGVDAWLDKEKLLPGQDWELEIRKAVRESDVVVVCLSCQFNQAGFRQKEVRIALDEADKQPEDEIFIIPARLEECETPESMRKWHWVNLFDPDGYEYLMRALLQCCEKIGPGLQLANMESELKELESKAIRFELVGDFWNALQIFYQIKRKAPLFPGVDKKIRGLELELETKREVQVLKAPVPRSRRNASVRILAILIGTIVSCVTVLLMWTNLLQNTNNLFPAPIAVVTPSQTQTIYNSTLTAPDNMPSSSLTVTLIPPPSLIA